MILKTPFSIKESNNQKFDLMARFYYLINLISQGWENYNHFLETNQALRVVLTLAPLMLRKPKKLPQEITGIANRAISILKDFKSDKKVWFPFSLKSDSPRQAESSPFVFWLPLAILVLVQIHSIAIRDSWWLAWTLETILSVSLRHFPQDAFLPKHRTHGCFSRTLLSHEAKRPLCDSRYHFFPPPTSRMPWSLHSSCRNSRTLWLWITYKLARFSIETLKTHSKLILRDFDIVTFRI